MDFIATGQHATGIIAIGQQATGIIAVGQMATGVIAIGQVARGVFTVGQLAFGFVGWGQAGLGLWHAAGMVGAGGRRGIGAVIPLVPSLGKKRLPPMTTTLEAVGAGRSGWIAADLAVDHLGLGLFQNGYRLPVKLDRVLQGGAQQVLAGGPRQVFASTSLKGSQYVCQRIVWVPPRPWESRSWWIVGAFQFMGLIALAVGWWLAAGNDLSAFFSQLADGTETSAPAPAQTPRRK